VNKYVADQTYPQLNAKASNTAREQSTVKSTRNEHSWSNRYDKAGLCVPVFCVEGVFKRVFSRGCGRECVVIEWGQEGMKTSAAERSSVVHCVDIVNRRLALSHRTLS
jgi:hypothetical protein